MQNREIIRYLVAGFFCAVGLLLLGFGPLLLSGKEVWAASVQSRIAMPIGESKQAQATMPFEQKQPQLGGAAYIKGLLGR
jgi:hypothetical protein